MKKIAFLFLTIENPNFPKLWDKYFRNNKDKFTIYLHPKFPDKVTWKRRNIINNLQETGWGFITRAYIELLKEAYKDENNYKFITISESCVPIQSFDNFYSDVINDSRSWIKSMPIKAYDYKARINIQETKPKPKVFLKNYARFCLNREHVKILISSELNFFHKMHVGDEFFLSVLYPLKNVKDFDVIYDDWEFVIEKQKQIKNQKRLLYEEQEIKKINKTKELNELNKEYQAISKNPKTIINVEDDLDKINNCKSYFYRKFSVKSNIEKYWKQIIDYHLIKHG